MQVFKIFKDAVLNKSDAVRGIFLKGGQVFLYLVILATLMAIPQTIIAGKLVSTLTTNFETVANNIPEYTLTDNQLDKDSGEAKVVNTDFIVYSFDPNDDVSTSELKDLNTNGLIIENQKDQLYLAVNNQDYHIKYSDGLNASVQKSLFNNMGQFQFLTYPITFIGIMIGQLVMLSFLQLMIALLCGFSKHSQRLKLTLGNRFRLGILQNTLPILVITVINLLPLNLPFQFEILLIAGVIRTVKVMKNIQVIKYKKTRLIPAAFLCVVVFFLNDTIRFKKRNLVLFLTPCSRACREASLLGPTTVVKRALSHPF